MIPCLNVPINDGAEKSMDYKPPLDVMPDSGEGRIELLSTLLLFHGALHHLDSDCTLLLLICVCSTPRVRRSAPPKRCSSSWCPPALSARHPIRASADPYREYRQAAPVPARGAQSGPRLSRPIRHRRHR